MIYDSMKMIYFSDVMTGQISMKPGDECTCASMFFTDKL